MGRDIKRMKKIRKKRIKSVKKQKGEHEKKIEKEKVRLDTTRDYWRKEIKNKFEKQIKEDEEYLEKR